MKREKRKHKIIRIILQILFFLWIPESFSVSLYALKSLIRSIVILRADLILEPILILLGTLVSTVLFGRYYCGYICSFGAMQDLSFDIRRAVKKGGKEYFLSAKADKFLSTIKYAVLVCIVILAFFGISIPAGSSPWSAFGSILSLIRGGSAASDVLTVGSLILLVIIVLTAFYYRAFCRYLCPVGALYSLVSGISRDRRNRVCKNNGDCCICQYRCGKYRVDYRGVFFAVLIFAVVNLYLILAPREIIQNTSEYGNAVETGPYTDGIFEGTGEGFRGKIKVTVTVQNGYIVSIEINDQKEDAGYFNSVTALLIPEIMESQSTEVDAVSGATYSSRGLVEAIEMALNAGGSPEEESGDLQGAEKEKPSEETVEGDTWNLDHLDDGVYEGTAIGFRGEITVAVTVKDHEIEKIRIISYYDNEEYLFHVAPAVIDEVMNREPLDVDAITGATYSVNGLTKAIANALQLDENTFTLVEARPRAEKHKEAHHVVQKFIESDEQYEELVEKYKDLMFGPDGKRITKN